MTDKIDVSEELVQLTEKSAETRVKNFDELMSKIEGVDDKKKTLWREIYQNAIADRQNSFIMFKATVKMADSNTNMSVHGKTIATFLERMAKANDQFIKLAELVEKATSSNGSIDPDDVYNQIKS